MHTPNTLHSASPLPHSWLQLCCQRTTWHQRRWADSVTLRKRAGPSLLFITRRRQSKSRESDNKWGEGTSINRPSCSSSHVTGKLLGLGMTRGWAGRSATNILITTLRSCSGGWEAMWEANDRLFFLLQKLRRPGRKTSIDLSDVSDCSTWKEFFVYLRVNIYSLFV